MKILIPTKKNSALENVLKRELPDSNVVFSTNTEKTKEELGDVDVLVPERMKVDKGVFDSAPRLKLVHCGTGYGNVDLEESKQRGICVATTPGVVAQSVAEHTLALVDCFCKKIAKLDVSMKQGEWSKDEFIPYHEKAGQTLGLIGFGDIGKRVARIADAYNMDVLVNRKKQNTEGFNIQLKELDDLLMESDFVSVHVPATKETQNLIGEREFDLMKNTAYFINTARGAVVDEDALIYALNKEQIAGAGIDVYKSEPLPKDSHLRKAKNIVLTPHTAYYTMEGLGRRFMAYAENIKKLEQGKPLANLV